MRSVRISISALMIFVAVAALEFGSLRVAGKLGVDTCNFLTVAILVWATIQARVREGRTGDFHFGFALAGWASYLLVIDALNYRPSLVGWIPEKLVDINYDWGTIQSLPGLRDRMVQQWRIAHFMMVLPVASLGGMVGWMAVRGRQMSDEEVGRAHPTEERIGSSS